MVDMAWSQGCVVRPSASAMTNDTVGSRHRASTCPPPSSAASTEGFEEGWKFVKVHRTLAHLDGLKGSRFPSRATSSRSRGEMRMPKRRSRRRRGRSPQEDLRPLRLETSHAVSIALLGVDPFSTMMAFVLAALFTGPVDYLLSTYSSQRDAGNPPLFFLFFALFFGWPCGACIGGVEPAKSRPMAGHGMDFSSFCNGLVWGMAFGMLGLTALHDGIVLGVARCLLVWLIVTGPQVGPVPPTRLATWNRRTWIVAIAILIVAAIVPLDVPGEPDSPDPALHELRVEARFYQAGYVIPAAALFGGLAGALLSRRWRGVPGGEDVAMRSLWKRSRAITHYVQPHLVFWVLAIALLVCWTFADLFLAARTRTVLRLIALVGLLLLPWCRRRWRIHSLSFGIVVAASLAVLTSITIDCWRFGRTRHAITALRMADDADSSGDADRARHAYVIFAAARTDDASLHEEAQRMGLPIDAEELAEFEKRMQQRGPQAE
jgi:hypothetical protein